MKPTLIGLILCLTACQLSGLEADLDTSRIVVTDAGEPLLTYQLAPETGAEPWRANYLHPVFAPSGALITENAPADHLHHRGLFWAWRGVFIGGKSAGDAWIGDHIRFATTPLSAEPAASGAMVVRTKTLWSTDAFGARFDFIEENTTITVWPLEDGKRRLDIRIALRALVPDVTLAGSDNEKGYGGLSFRFGRPDRMDIRSDGNAIRATPTPIETGDTVDFLFRDAPEGWPHQISIRCQASGQPWHNWILRQEPSMQNCAWPGRRPAGLPVDRDTLLEASLIIG